MLIKGYSGPEMRETAPKPYWKGKQHDMENMENIEVRGNSIGQITQIFPDGNNQKKRFSFFDAATISKGKAHFSIPKLANGFISSIYSRKLF